MSGADVHPSAIGNNVTPRTGSSSSASEPHPEAAVSNDDASGGGGFGNEPYPEQLHSGAVGVGPNFTQESTMAEKWIGVKEEMKGKVTHNPGKVEEGRKRRTGELKREQMERDAKFDPHDDKSPGPKTFEETHAVGREKSNFEQAASVAPEGTHQGEKQRKGGEMKHFGE
ncbi:hypothetical protein BDN71DRAFT_1449963 [Pleurotus eryngii]|uniref:Uncharacterized protein n=1 Tax=Pleurotus eryngii TaxID=5323 RepID=A0A9P5ZTL1_PLEER|nr:hypothetical protein BDN71DRAFT_1449963 [Pleurotus eryngii]